MNHADEHVDVKMKQQLDDIARYAKNTRIAVLQLLDVVDDDFRKDIHAMVHDAQQIQHLSNLLRIKAQLKQIESKHGP